MGVLEPTLVGILGPSIRQGTGPTSFSLVSTVTGTSLYDKEGRKEGQMKGQS